jgi:LuxR family quorum-sensing system transcriptional regulator ExpR
LLLHSNRRQATHVKDTYYNDIAINTLIQSELDAFFEDFKGIVFAYAIMNKKDPSQMRIINNSPEWFDIYLDRKYQFIDPVIIRALRCVEDFSGKVMSFCRMVIT